MSEFQNLRRTWNLEVFFEGVVGLLHSKPMLLIWKKI
jgi:hypothetical protein